MQRCLGFAGRTTGRKDEQRIVTAEPIRAIRFVIRRITDQAFVTLVAVGAVFEPVLDRADQAAQGASGIAELAVHDAHPGCNMVEQLLQLRRRQTPVQRLGDKPGAATRVVERKVFQRVL